MFRKVHIYLTALCAGITTAILIVMSLLYLYLSEKELYENQFRSFQNDINTIATSLEQQSVISMEWLSKMEAHGGYTFYALDNGIPFLYNRLTNLSESSEIRSILDECLEVYESDYEIGFREETGADSYNTCHHVEFPFNPSGKNMSFISVSLNCSGGRPPCRFWYSPLLIFSGNRSRDSECASC